MIHEYITTILSSQEWEFVIKTLICVVAWFLIWQERQARGKNAWVTTFTFVITWSMLFTFLSEHVDPASTSRIAAQIVTGIWFLGAGLIFINDNKVKNLTTAAGIWFSWAVGMAIGFWYYGVALIATILARLAPKSTDAITTKLSHHQHSHNAHDNHEEKDDLHIDW